MTGEWYLSGLWPPFAEAVRTLDLWCQYYGLSLVLVSGFRSNEEQAQLYAQGRSSAEIRQQVKKQGKGGSVTDAPPGYSAHNYGLAVDLDPDSRDFKSCFQLAQQLGFGTVSWDPDHLEWPQWRSLVGV